MQISMKRIESWLDEEITAFIRRRQSGGGRCQEYDLFLWLDPFPTSAHYGVMAANLPDWMALSKQKRVNRIRKILDVMLRERRIEIRNESGDPEYSVGYTRYIYELTVLDRIVAQLGDD